MHKKLLVTGILMAVFIVTTGCGLFSQIVQDVIGQDPSNSEPTEEEVVMATATEAPSATPSPTATVVPTETATKQPTNTPTATEVPFVRAGDITLDSEGQSIEVCGRVTDYEQIYCPNCINGFYSYLMLDDNLMIISYEWVFGTDWIDGYIMVKDTVETMGSNPIFIFGGTEGWNETECEIMPNGTLSCNGGDYFKFVYDCSYLDWQGDI